MRSRACVLPRYGRGLGGVVECSAAEGLRVHWSCGGSVVLALHAVGFAQRPGSGPVALGFMTIGLDWGSGGNRRRALHRMLGDADASNSIAYHHHFTRSVFAAAVRPGFFALCEPARAPVYRSWSGGRGAWIVSCLELFRAQSRASTWIRASVAAGGPAMSKMVSRRRALGRPTVCSTCARLEIGYRSRTQRVQRHASGNDALGGWAARGWPCEGALSAAAIATRFQPSPRHRTVPGRRSRASVREYRT
jgi:hypothetical protein